MSEEEVIAQIVGRAYEAIAFKPGGDPDWRRFNEVFHPSAILALRVFPHDEAVGVLNLRDYAAAQMRHGIREEGYSETPGERKIEIVGEVATVRQRFTMNLAKRLPVQAVDAFSLVRVDGRWLIVSVVSDMAAPTAG